jgi:hypothetical protein
MSRHDAASGCTVAAQAGFAFKFLQCRDAGEEKKTNS